MVGFEGAIDAERPLSLKSSVEVRDNDLPSLTKEEPKETILLSLKATLATALANGMPSY